MSEINTTKFYQFLSKFQKDGQNWADVADGQHGNGDGTVIKSEFRNFLNKEWNGEENGELTNDLVNSFWKKIDTNTSASKISGTKLKNLNALDKKEVEALDKRLEVYVSFDEFVANNVTVPAVLTSTGSKWKTDVTDELSKLVEKFISDGCKGDLDTVLTEALPGIANKCTGQYCAIEYQDTLKSGILADYPNYKVADDSVLQGLINKFIETIDAETDTGAIKSEIQQIMDAYLSTAGLGDESPYDLGALGYDYNQLNGIQKEVITQTIKNDLANEAKNYEGYEDAFNNAVQQFIDAKIKEGGTFETLKASAGEFASSKFKTQLDNIVAFDKTYKDVTEESDFYQQLKAEFGDALAQKIAKNDRYIQAYKDIINDVRTKISSGEMTMDEVSGYILEQISKNIDKFFANGLGDLSITELNTTYDKLAAAAEKQTDDDLALKQHREAAIKYCDALTKKGASLKQAVIDAFGSSDYKGAINNMYPGDIQEVMAELKVKATEIGDVTEFTVSSWNNLPENVVIAQKGNKNYQLNATIMNGNTPIDSSRITYQVTGANAEITNITTLTIKGAEQNAYSSIKVDVLVDGVKIGTQTISVKTVNVSHNWANMDGNISGCIARGGAARGSNGNITLQEAYTTNACLILNSTNGEFTRNWKETINNARGKIADFVNGTLCNFIKTSGNYDEQAMKIAAQKTIELYQGALTQIENGDMAGKKSNKDSTINYDGENYTFRTQKWYKEKTANNTDVAASHSAANNQLGLQLNESYNSPSTYQVVLNMKCIMDMFNKFYAQALS